METYLSLSQLMSDLADGLALGLMMFGDHVVWILMLPPLWIIAACLIWMKIESDDEELDSLYVARAEQNLPRLKELAKQRSTEILDVRPVRKN